MPSGRCVAIFVYGDNLPIMTTHQTPMADNTEAYPIALQTPVAGTTGLVGAFMSSRSQRPPQEQASAWDHLW